jgi:hypothetical protein
MFKILYNTTVNLPKLDFSLNRTDTVVSIGSCFADSILNLLAKHNICTSKNPTGIIYNSRSISDALDFVSGALPFKEELIFNYLNLYHSWYHHGSFSNKDLTQTLLDINSKFIEFKNIASSAKLFIITISSSVVYRLIETGEVVANCHKMPSKFFNKDILSVEDNIVNIKNICDKISIISPQAKIVFTVSPVRHYRGDLVLNSLSKANILAAIHSVKADNEFVYFPSYEILNDELRDYRYYADDLMHPSELAQKIIFNKFLETFYSEDEIKELESSYKEYLASCHRSLH